MVGMGVVCIGQAIGVLHAIGGFDTIPYFVRYPGVDGNGHCEKKSGRYHSVDLVKKRDHIYESMPTEGWQR